MDGVGNYALPMSRVGDFADDDVAGWIRLAPELGRAMAAFSSAVYNGKRLPMRVREIARTVIAHDNECVVCLNTRDADGSAAGVDEDLYAHAVQWRSWPGFTEPERIAAEFAHRFATGHTALRDDDEFWERCHRHFSDELVAELAMSCAMWLGMGRMLRTLDIGQACTLTLPSRG